MAIYRNRRSRKVKFFLLSVIAVALVGMAAIFIGYRVVSNKPELLLSALGEKANVSLGKIQHTATRGGVREWTLEAESARLINAEKKMLMAKLSVVYYMKDGNEAYLTAGEGILDTESNDIELTGNVVLISEPYELQTEKLIYRHKERKFYSDEPIRILSTTAYLAADAMSFDLESKSVLFKGNVEGIFAEKLIL